MSLLVKSVNGEPVIEGTAERVEHFSTALLAAAVHTDWLRVDNGRIVLSDGTRTVTYSMLLVADGLPVNDNTFVAAQLVSDVNPMRAVLP